MNIAPIQQNNTNFNAGFRVERHNSTIINSYFKADSLGSDTRDTFNTLFDKFTKMKPGVEFELKPTIYNGIVPCVEVKNTATHINAPFSVIDENGNYDNPIIKILNYLTENKTWKSKALWFTLPFLSE